MNELIRRAVEILRGGRLVAFPTETVYGLGADATQSEAVRRIFTVKGRPSTNPLIVHVAGACVARQYATAWPDAAEALAERFWPGPLTLVLPKSPLIVPEATAGRMTVGLRAPDHPLTLELLRQFDGPVVGPSANRSTRVSPTTAGHVRAELGGSVDLILDGGVCRVGIESTVLDLSGEQPRILRPGGISRQQIEAVIGPVAVFHGHVSAEVAAASPGQHAVHYSPAAAAYRFDSGRRDAVARWLTEHPSVSTAIMILGRVNAADPLRQTLSARHELIEMPSAAEDYARHLYATLHAIDQRGIGTIWVEFPPDTPPWAAVRDRLTRATKEPGTPSSPSPREGRGSG